MISGRGRGLVVGGRHEGELLEDLEDALGDEGRLGVRVWQRDERGFRAERFARRAEVLLEAAGVMVSG